MNEVHDVRGPFAHDVSCWSEEPDKIGSYLRKQSPIFLYRDVMQLITPVSLGSTLLRMDQKWIQIRDFQLHLCGIKHGTAGHKISLTKLRITYGMV